MQTVTASIFAVASMLSSMSSWAVSAQQCSLPSKPIPVRPLSISQSPSMRSAKHSATVYKVGAFGIRGAQQATEDFTAIFQEYFEMYVSPQFADVPSTSIGDTSDDSRKISFELVPIFNSEEGFLDFLASNELDFMLMHTGAHSCMESEVGVRSLATVTSTSELQGQTFELNQYGGVLFTAKDKAGEIRDIEDVRDRTTACVALEAFGAGQLQFRELIMRDIHHLQDVAQVVFMEKQPNVVNAVLQGKIEVGYVRTGQLERTIDERTGNLVDMSEVHILGEFGTTAEDGTSPPLIDVNGNLFPYPSSTHLYPEWGFSAFSHVSNDIVEAVQEAILQISQHAAIAPSLLACFERSACDPLRDTHKINALSTQLTSCHEQCMYELHDLQEQQLGSVPFRRCDTTLLQALAAHFALTQANVAGFAPTASYMEIHNMQTNLAFLTKDHKCIRTEGLADGVTCPAGHFPKSKEDMTRGCEDANLDCHGFSCLCKPCVKASDVDFFPVLTDVRKDDDIDLALAANNSTIRTGSGCEKFDICGYVSQNDYIVYYAIDNRRRNDVVLSVEVLDGDVGMRYTMDPVPSRPHEYQVVVKDTNIDTGEHIVFVRVDEEQVPDSPFRLQIDERDCVAATGDAYMIPTSTGKCVCQTTVTVELFGVCVPYSIFIPSVVLPTLLMMGIAVLVYVEHKRKAADAIWKVDPKELIYGEPPQVLGRGTFGMVLLAEYRGTKVAVKRVLPVGRHARNLNRRASLKFDFDDDSLALAKLEMRMSASSKQPNEPNLELQDSANSTDDASGADDQQSLHSLGKDSTASAKFQAKLIRRSSGVSSVSSSSSSRMDGSHSRTNRGSTGDLLALSSMSSVARDHTPRRRTSKFKDIFGSLGSASTKRMEREFIQEMRLLSQLRHPCITTTMGAVIDKCSEPMLIMEHMQLGSLYDLLHNDSMVLNGEILLPVLRDVARGLRFLHAAAPQIIHSDLKAANVLVDERFHAKVSDFGLSRKRYFFQDKAAAAGTPYWMAPELLRRETGNTTTSDVYAFGVVLYEVLTRKDPYEGESLDAVLQLVADAKIQKRPTVPKGLSSESVQLMKACLREDPTLRPTAEEISVRLEMLDADHIRVATSDRRFGTGEAPNGKKRSAEDLLSQLFPAHIATALREGRKVEPEQHDSVTVYFSDIVDYTKISSGLSPTKVSSLLDRLYTKFDNLCDIHDVFKVETVGDSYMTVTNIHKKDPAHVSRMVAFAMDAVDAAKTTLIDEDQPSRGFVEIRSGFNTGPAVAHVVGTRNPRYSIIGDTVNTASRMESNSLPGRIQCSEVTASLLELDSPEGFNIKRRGDFNIKGKGEMTLFWVEREGAEDHEEEEGGDNGTDGDEQEGSETSSPRNSAHGSNKRHSAALETIVELTAEVMDEKSQRSLVSGMDCDDSESGNYATSQELWVDGVEKGDENV